MGGGDNEWSSPRQLWPHSADPLFRKGTGDPPLFLYSSITAGTLPYPDSYYAPGCECEWGQSVFRESIIEPWTESSRKRKSGLTQESILYYPHALFLYKYAGYTYTMYVRIGVRPAAWFPAFYLDSSRQHATHRSQSQQQQEQGNPCGS